MRPVDKGAAPELAFNKYQDAEPYLEERIGPYCSYCELHIQHVPEVEHKEARSRGGDELQWDNLLLTCKYCNTRKGAEVAKGDKDKYLWPDEDDTFHAFSYEGDIPKLNEEYLEEAGEDVRERADRLYRLLKLDNIPIRPTDKDRRYLARSEARNNALSSKAGLMKIRDSKDKEEYLDLAIRLAKSGGFFSVWMEVFKDDSEIQERLITAFKGTRREFIKQ